MLLKFHAFYYFFLEIGPGLFQLALTICLMHFVYLLSLLFDFSKVL